MIIPYLRSSSIGAFKLCPVNYFLVYTLGLPGGTNRSAVLGNVVHKSLETLAWASYHTARGNSEYVDETFGPTKISDITPEWATEKAYWYYKSIEPDVGLSEQPSKWSPNGHLNDCILWTRKCIEFNGGYFDPRNMDVLQPEQRFDITIDRPWAKYSFETPEGLLEGQLNIKGTMDLIVRDKNVPDEIEVVDFKTGRRRDWGEADESKAEKTWAKLNTDDQLLLYYYAVAHLYPEASHIHVTIIYINDGGPFRLSFGRERITEAEEMLRKYFEAIRDTRTPEPIYGPPCWTFCGFGKKSRGQIEENKTTCKVFLERLRKHGTDEVVKRWGKSGAYNRYGSGGGRQTSE